MKNKELLAIQARLNSIEITNATIKCAVVKNKRLLEQEIKDLRVCLAPTKKWEAFQKEYVELVKKHAKKDEKGKPIIENNFIYVDPSQMEEFNKELAELKEEHKEAHEERERQQKDYEDLLEKEVDPKFELHKLKKEDIVNCTNPQMDLLYDIIDDTEN